jgi:hypothetical protein
MTTAFLLVAGLGSASASVITFSGAPTGLTFTVESVTQVAAANDLDAADATNDTYDIPLRLVTTSAYDETTYSGTDYLRMVSIDIGDTYSAGTLLSENAVGTWAYAGNNTGPSGSSGQCNASVAGALCAEDPVAAPDLVLDTNATSDWVFRVDLGATGVAGQFGSTTGLVFTIAGIKASNGQWDNFATYTLSGGTLQPGSTDGLSAVPEPASLFLFGTGAVVLGRMKRRSKTAAK